MSSSGPGYLPYVSKIELICRLVRRWHSTPLLNTSITRRGGIHSGAVPGRNGSAMGGWNCSAIVGCSRTGVCSRSRKSSQTTMDTFLTSGLSIYVADRRTQPGRRSFGPPQTRLCRRHEQQSQAESLNAEIRSGAEEGAEIETDRGEWVSPVAKKESSRPFLVVQTYGFSVPSHSVYIPYVFLYLLTKFCNSVFVWRFY